MTKQEQHTADRETAKKLQRAIFATFEKALSARDTAEKGVDHDAPMNAEKRETLETIETIINSLINNMDALQSIINRN